MPIEKGHYVVAKNVLFREFRPYQNALLVVSVGKRVKVRNPDAPDGRHVLLYPNEVLAYYEDRAHADRAAKRALVVWQRFESRIDTARIEQSTAVRIAAKMGKED